MRPVVWVWMTVRRVSPVGEGKGEGGGLIALAWSALGMGMGDLMQVTWSMPDLSGACAGFYSKQKVFNY